MRRRTVRRLFAEVLVVLLVASACGGGGGPGESGSGGGGAGSLGGGTGSLGGGAGSLGGGTGSLGGGTGSLGGGTGSLGGGTGSSDGGSEADEIAATVEALDAYIDSLDPGLDRSARRQAIISYFSARPSRFAAWGETGDGVFAVLSQGVPLLMLDNRQADPPPGPDPEKPGEVRRKGDVPRSVRARLVHTLGPAFANHNPQLGSILGARGYSVVTDPGTVESLRSIQGDGVIHLSAHGGQCLVPVFDASNQFVREPDGGPRLLPDYGLWTATNFQKDLGPYLADLKAGRLGLGKALDRVDATTGQRIEPMRFWITSKFISTYWSMAPDGLMWASACGSHSAAASALVSAATSKAGLYVGWSAPVRSSNAFPVADFVLDRLLGANQRPPKETPPQRPFGHVEVFDDLRSRNLHVYPDPEGPGTTEVRYSKGSGTFDLLAPSIRTVYVDEDAEEAILEGLFGMPEPAARKVLINGQEVAIKSWTETKVRVALARSGPTAAGDVKAVVRDHESNVRRITEWRLSMDFTWEFLDHAPAKVAGPVDLHIRADLGDFRVAPGKSPVKPVRFAMGARDSTATLTASGTFRQGDCTTTYVGSTPLQPGGFEIVSPAAISWLRFDAEPKTFSFSLLLGAFPPLPWAMQIQCPDVSLTQPFTPAFGFFERKDVQYGASIEDAFSGPVLPSAVVTLDDTWSIPAGEVIENTSDLKVTWRWSRAAASYPPDPDAAQ